MYPVSSSMDRGNRISLYNIVVRVFIDLKDNADCIQMGDLRFAIDWEQRASTLKPPNHAITRKLIHALNAPQDFYPVIRRELTKDAFNFRREQTHARAKH
jgi:hypothetical protein